MSVRIYVFINNVVAKTLLRTNFVALSKKNFYLNFKFYVMFTLNLIVQKFNENMVENSGN